MIDRLVYRESVGFRQKKDCLGTIPLTVFFLLVFCGNCLGNRSSTVFFLLFF